MKLSLKEITLAVLPVVGFIFLESCCENNKPQVSFTADKTVITVGDTIQFTDLSDAGNGVFVTWGFGGGENISGYFSSSPLVVYNTPGVYDVELNYKYDCNNENKIVAKSEPDYITVNPASTGGGCGGTGTISDIDGNTYNIVQIGNQCWMKENLKVSSGITQVTDSLGWKNISYNSLFTPAWCYYNNDSSNENTYGKLYNWYALSTTNICPDGWHIPSLADWQILIDYLGGENVAGGKLKATNGWDAPNNDASNSSQFSAYPGGMRVEEGGFSLLGAQGIFWTTENNSNYGATAISLKNINGVIYTLSGTAAKGEGHSCRCVKD